MRHLLEIDDLQPDELRESCGLADAAPTRPRCWSGSGVACCSRSRRPGPATRPSWPSWSSAVIRSTSRADEVGIDTREIGRGRHPHPGLLPRGDRRPGLRPRALERMAASTSCPSSTCCSDEAHPLQALADLLTIAGRVRPARRADGGLRGRRQQRGPVVGLGRRRWSAWRCGSLARRATSFDERSRPADGAAGSSVVETDRPRRGGRGCRRRLHRRLDLDGPGGRGRASVVEAFEGFTVDDAPVDQAAAGGRRSCTAFRPPGRGGHRRGRRRRRKPVWPQAANRMHCGPGPARLAGGQA